MIKFNVLYKNRVEYPCKLSKLFTNVCSQVGLEAGNTDFTNNDYMILGNPFTNNEDCRTVLSNIAQLAGGFAKIGRDNKVYIKTLKNISNLLEVRYVNFSTVKELNLTPIYLLSGEKDNADEQLDGNNYFNDFSKNEQWGELNSLVLGLSSIEGENTALDDKTSINENGLTEIIIQDNYFLTSQEERKKVIVPIWDTLKGIKYLPFKTNYYGYPYLDTGDMIYIQDTKDNGYISYVFNHTFKFNGAFSGTINTPALTKTQTSYKNTFDLKTKFRNAERSIDKINGQIKDIIKEVGDRTEKETSVTQDIDGIVQVVATKDEVTKKMNELKQTVDSTINKLTNSGGNNIFYYSKEYWSTLNKDEQLSIEEYSDTNVKQNSVSGLGYILNNGNAIQSQVIKNGKYTISFSYYKLIDLAEGYVLINGNRYDLDTEEEEIGKWKEKIVTIDIDTNTIDFEIISDTDNSFIIADLMCSKGNEKTIWSQNANETITDTVSIGKGIQVNSSTTNTYTRIDADGNRTYNASTGEVVAEQTDKGTKTKQLEVKEEAKINSLLIQEINGQAWMTGIGG